MTYIAVIFTTNISLKRNENLTGLQQSYLQNRLSVWKCWRKHHAAFMSYPRTACWIHVSSICDQRISTTWFTQTSYSKYTTNLKPLDKRMEKCYKANVTCTCNLLHHSHTCPLLKMQKSVVHRRKEGKNESDEWWLNYCMQMVKMERTEADRGKQ